MAKKMQHCFNCGEDLGVYQSLANEIEVCGNAECQKEARDAYRQQRDERVQAAFEDDYMRY